MNFKLKKEVYLVDKNIEISGPCGLSIEVNYHNVNQKIIDNVVYSMINILNENWTEQDTKDCESGQLFKL